MSIDLGKSTNKGTAMVKLAHQFQSQILFKDEYISWFFDEAVGSPVLVVITKDYHPATSRFSALVLN